MWLLPPDNPLHQHTRRREVDPEILFYREHMLVNRPATRFNRWLWTQLKNGIKSVASIAFF